MGAWVYACMGVWVHGRMCVEIHRCTHRVKVQRDFDGGHAVVALGIHDRKIDVLTVPAHTHPKPYTPAPLRHLPLLHIHLYTHTFFDFFPMVAPLTDLRIGAV